MVVKELIEALKELPLDARVLIDDENYYDINCIEGRSLTWIDDRKRITKGIALIVKEFDETDIKGASVADVPGWCFTDD